MSLSSVSRLDGKIAIVTGASRGQGEAEARQLIAEGACVVCGDILDDEGNAVAESLGGSSAFVHLDVRKEEEWNRALDVARELFGEPTILINNAGITHACPILEETAVAITELLDVNVVGVLLGMKTVAKSMITAGGGSIVNVSSNSGLSGVAGLAAYSASKWAVRGLTRSGAIELGPYGIRVNSIHPGAIETPMLRETGFEFDPNRYPLRRIGTSAEVALLVAFLASAESKFITGAEMAIDGGSTAGFSPILSNVRELASPS